ncbi:hypothetical protein Xen7305DRAFT_00048250 [Xenococcus sp. PCC 7305]|nr:hypothetical protein Xen7305DRAFT_00048250 [Xenococcus sp. PCC 7305]
MRDEEQGKLKESRNLLITYYLLLITHYPLPITHYPLPKINSYLQLPDQLSHIP